MHSHFPDTQLFVADTNVSGRNAMSEVLLTDLHPTGKYSKVNEKKEP